jgi:hypothetical protein
MSRAIQDAPLNVDLLLLHVQPRPLPPQLQVLAALALLSVLDLGELRAGEETDKIRRDLDCHENRSMSG